MLSPTTAPELLADIAFGSAAILGGAWLASQGLRSASAGTRHLCWTVAVVAVLVLPFAHGFAPRVTLDGMPTLRVGSWRMSPAGPERARPTPPKVARVSGEDIAVTGAVPDSRRDPAPSTAREAADPGARSEGAVKAEPGEPAPLDDGRLRLGAALVWFSGAALVLALLGRERWHLRCLRKASRRVTTGRLRTETDVLTRRMGIDRRVTIHLCPTTLVPMTWGSFVPRVLLPAGAGGWSDARLRSVLLHELAHVRRRDVLTQSLAATACVLYWFNPLAWVAARHMREERERAADDLVLQSGVSAPAYAEQLVALIRTLRETPMSLTAVSMARTSRLGDRVAAILDERRSRGQPGISAVGGALGLSLGIVGTLTIFTPAASSPLEAESAPREEAVTTNRSSNSDPTSAISLGGPAGTGRTAPLPDTLPRCWRGDSNRRLSVNTAEGYREVVREDDRCRATIRLTGRLEFDADYSAITGVSAGGEVLIEERTASVTRRFEVRGDADGTPVYEYRVNDGPAVTGYEAEAAFRSRLLVLFRYGGVASTERAARMLAEDGLEHVLAEARAIPPDAVAADYLLVALGTPDLSPDELAEIADVVREQVGSDVHAGHVLATVLAKHPEVASPPGREAVAGAMASVGSDVAHVDMLITALESNGGPDLDALLLRSAREEIGSDAAMVGFLAEFVRLRPGAPVEGGHAEDFWRAADTVGSDGEHARLLRRIIASGGAESALLERALTSAADGIGSDGILATYLQWTVTNFGDGLSDAGSRRAFREALDAIGSDRLQRGVEATVRDVGADHLLDT